MATNHQLGNSVPANAANVRWAFKCSSLARDDEGTNSNDRRR
eukprot:CAMPEP_0197928076 /NCGR_PEP_ID=MMETSP1439-20131203/101734_1 /TAXON_ID=66791 /ORGANISM="Gonyaulax spinifera, Strain CCMP409" /LENGTH=41 /DNA_ID= /DNA_START= /DNA_END= /DNA_ORIENTATION=